MSIESPPQSIHQEDKDPELELQGQTPWMTLQKAQDPIPTLITNAAPACVFNQGNVIDWVEWQTKSA